MCIFSKNSLVEVSLAFHALKLKKKIKASNFGSLHKYFGASLLLLVKSTQLFSY